DYLSESVKKIVASGYKLMEKFFTRGMGLSLAEKYYQEMYPDGVWILNYPTVNEKFIEHERTGEVENKVLYTGNVSHVRGARYHAKLPVIDPDIDVHFVGKCPSELADEMYDVAGEHKNTLHIEGIDSFSEEQVRGERCRERTGLAGIDMFKLTEHYMKQELAKFFEYMNAGIPVICSDFPVWKAYVERYECSIAVNPED